MNTSRRMTARSGGVVVHHLQPRVIEIRAEGYMDRAAMVQSFADCAALLTQHPNIDLSMWDLSALTGYDPGNAAMAIRWWGQYGTVVQKCVVVTRNQTVAALAHVAQVMIPSIRSHVVTRRDDALALLDEFARARRRTAA